MVFFFGDSSSGTDTQEAVRYHICTPAPLTHTDTPAWLSPSHPLTSHARLSKRGVRGRGRGNQGGIDRCKLERTGRQKPVRHTSCTLKAPLTLPMPLSTGPGPSYRAHFCTQQLHITETDPPALGRTGTSSASTNARQGEGLQILQCPTTQSKALKRQKSALM